MQKLWLKQYPATVPAEIDPLANANNLADLFIKSVSKYSDLPAFQHMGSNMRYAEVATLAKQFASFLQQQGLKPGARIALMLPNVFAYPICFFGTLLAGMVVVNVNPQYTSNELTYQLTDSAADLIVVLENFAHTVAQTLSKIEPLKVVVTSVADGHTALKGYSLNLLLRHVKKAVPKWSIPDAFSLPDALQQGSEQEAIIQNPRPEDLALLQYTGGTTGKIKAAMLSHFNLLANIEQASAWLKIVFDSGEKTIITALPLYHIFSLLANCLTFFNLGGCNILITNPRDIGSLINTMKQQKFDAITGVNTLFNSLLNHRKFDSIDFSKLKLTLGGGMPVQQAVAEKWQAHTNVPLLEAYGLTEASPAVCINPLDNFKYNGAVGLPISSTEIAIRDQHGNDLGIDQVGELCVKGPQVMSGYWQRPKETAETLHEGWLKTGDLAKVDKLGYVYIVDRQKDMILISGFNVYPNEVEAIIAKHPKVVEVAVVGKQDPIKGEVVCAYIVPEDDTLKAADIRRFCKNDLAAYKIPTKVIFKDELPKSQVGKILRRELK